MRVLRFILNSISSFKVYILGVFICVILISVDANVKPYLIKLIIDTTINSQSNNIFVLIFIYIVFQVFMIGVFALRDWFSVRFEYKFQNYLVSKFINIISKYKYNFFQKFPSGTVLAKSQDLFNYLTNIIFTIIYQFVFFICSAVITFFILAKVHILFFIGIMTWISIFFIIIYLGIKKINPLIYNYAEAKSQIWGCVSDYLTNIFSIKSFARDAFEKRKLYKVGKKFVLKAEPQGYFLMKFYILQGFLILIYTVTFLFMLMHFHSKGIITPGDFALVFMLNLTLFENLYNLSYQLQEFVVNYGTVNQSIKILELSKEFKVTNNHKDNLVVTKGEIVFNKVCFHYKKTHHLFKEMNVKIHSGEKVGLVGYSGCGKTTFINLILKIYNISSGKILIDGQDINKVTYNSLRNSISIVPQDLLLFNRTIKENISYGQLGASDDEIIYSAKKAHAHSFIIELPQGYNTLVGERGTVLSGGQRQRILIARAILKNAPIVILDEATSQLDLYTEKKIHESFQTLIENKTSIVIAHRLSTLLNMDRILVFDNGTIVQDGTHNELYNQNGLYKKLLEINNFNK